MIGIIDITASKKLNKQAIVTKFLVITVPIFATGHYFIDKNSMVTYKAKKCKENLLKGYLLTSLPFVFLILLFLWGVYSNFPVLPIFVIYGIFALSFSLAYNIEPTEEEKKERMLYQKSITLNALPEYLILSEQIIIRDSITYKLKKYLRDYDMNWLENIKNGNYNSFSLPLYFAAMGYEKEINNTEENIKLYNVLKEQYSQEISKINTINSRTI